MQTEVKEGSSVSEERLKPMANRAYEDLFQKIVYCEYAPGQEINEKQLVEETGFGRTPLREALLLLKKEGMVDIFPRKGMRISTLTEKSVSDLYQARKLIEPAVMVEYKTLYSKSKLLQFQQRFQQATQAKDLDRFLLDIEFHSYLISIMAVSYTHLGGEQGDQNDHAGIALHKHSNKNKENVHGNQKDPFVVNDRDEPLSELLGNTLLGQYPREGGGCGHDQHDGRSCGQSLLQTLSEFLASQLSIPKAQQGGIDDCHRAGLCGGEDAHTDAADDNDGQTEGKNGRTEGFPKHGPCHFALSQRRVIPLVRDAGDHEHHGGAQQDTRPKSGDEQLADGYICDKMCIRDSPNGAQVSF